jgi:hypothetical protein
LQQKAPPHVPSPPPPHAFVQALPAHVGVPPLHAVHAPPPLPHAALSAVPSTHVEVAESQQPPLHGAPPAHELEHAWAVQAMPVGQSPAALQPHAPWTHWLPWDDAVQSTQLPGAPQLLAFPAQGGAPSGGGLTSGGASCGGIGASVGLVASSPASCGAAWSAPPPSWSEASLAPSADVTSPDVPSSTPPSSAPDSIPFVLRPHATRAAVKPRASAPEMRTYQECGNRGLRSSRCWCRRMRAKRAIAPEVD